MYLFCRRKSRPAPVWDELSRCLDMCIPCVVLNIHSLHSLKRTFLALSYKVVCATQCIKSELYSRDIGGYAPDPPPFFLYFSFLSVGQLWLSPPSPPLFFFHAYHTLTAVPPISFYGNYSSKTMQGMYV